MSQLDNAPRLEELRHGVRAELDLGHFNRAIVHCDAIIELARGSDDRDLLDQTICNRAGILVARGDGDQVVGELRKVLLRSASAANSFQAAYTVSQYHEGRKEKDRGLFYARVALDHARKSELPECIASACNRLGNLLLLDSYFEDACDHYRQALDLLPGDRHLDRALILSNTGYCQVVLHSYAPGLRSLHRSLRLIRQRCAETWERFPRLALSYAYLELGRPESSRRHAAAALVQSRRAGSAEQIKNSLFLLGETEKLAGDEDAAYDYFEQLQEEFYPGDLHLRDLLMATDIRKLINLMA